MSEAPSSESGEHSQGSESDSDGAGSSEREEEFAPKTDHDETVETESESEAETETETEAEDDVDEDVESKGPDVDGLPDLGEHGVLTVPAGQRPFVTISKNDTIAINTALRDMHIPEWAEAIHAGVDGNELVLQPRPEKDSRFHNISEEEGSFKFGAGSILRHHQIVHDETRRYRPEWDEDFQAIVVDVSQEGEIPPSQRQEDAYDDDRNEVEADSDADEDSVSEK